MKRLILIRHGEYDEVNGQYLLNDEGRQQLTELAEKLKAFVGDERVGLHTSSAPRATASAEILADTLGIQAEEHRELWSGSDGVGHNPNIHGLLDLIDGWQKDRDILIIVTHMEVVDRLPNAFANRFLNRAIRSVHVAKGRAGIIDCATCTMTLLT